MTTGQGLSRKTATRGFSYAETPRIRDSLLRARRREGPLIDSVPLP
jgi:hypothetical protein